MAYAFHLVSYLRIGNIPPALPTWEYGKIHLVAWQLTQCKERYIPRNKLKALSFQALTQSLLGIRIKALLKKIINLLIVGHYTLLNGMPVAPVREAMLNNTWKSRSVYHFPHPALVWVPWTLVSNEACLPSLLLLHQTAWKTITDFIPFPTLPAMLQGSKSTTIISKEKLESGLELPQKLYVFAVLYKAIPRWTSTYCRVL